MQFFLSCWLLTFAGGGSGYHLEKSGPKYVHHLSLCSHLVDQPLWLFKCQTEANKKLTAPTTCPMQGKVLLQPLLIFIPHTTGAN